MESQYFDKKTETCKYLEIYFGKFDELFQVEILRNDGNGGRRRLKAEEFKMKIARLDEYEIGVRLDFADPLSVGPEDIVEIDVKFDGFEKGLEKNHIEYPIPRQTPEGLAT